MNIKVWIVMFLVQTILRLWWNIAAPDQFWTSWSFEESITRCRGEKPNRWTKMKSQQFSRTLLKVKTIINNYYEFNELALWVDNWTRPGRKEEEVLVLLAKVCSDWERVHRPLLKGRSSDLKYWGRCKVSWFIFKGPQMYRCKVWAPLKPWEGKQNDSTPEKPKTD